MSSSLLRALVVDDEDLARAELVARLEERDDVEVIAQCDEGARAIELVRDLAPDVAFLDICMPEVDGIEVALAVEGTGTAVVFTTAFDHFAVRAFELGSIDYLLKPIDAERLDLAVRRVFRLAPRGHRPTLESFLRRPPEDTLVFRSMGSVIVLEYSEVMYVEAQGNYVHVHAHVRGKDRCWLHRSTFNDVTDRLGPHGFVRVHRSYLVNRRQLAEIRTKGKGLEAVLSTGQRVPVSRTLRGRLEGL